MAKNFKFAATALAASLLLVGCSNQTASEPAADPTTEATNLGVGNVATTETEATAQYDHGAYFPEYRTPFRQPDSIGTGSITQSNNIADGSVIGFEVNPELNVLTESGFISAAGDLWEFMYTNYASALKEGNVPIQGGYWISNTTEDKNYDLTTAIIRLDSPETARKVAQQLNEISTTQGGSLYEYQQLVDDPSLIEPDFVYAPTTVKSPSRNTLASGTVGEKLNQVDQKNATLQTVTPHNEFVLYTESITDLEDSEVARADVGTFLNKQIPLLDLIPTHKTKAGYGKTDGFLPADEHGLTRYAVTTPAELQGSLHIGGELSARGYATTQTNPEYVLKAFDLAGIDHVGTWETSVGQASNPDSANLFQSAYLSSAKEDDFTSYDEPQALPNTKCITTDTSLGGHLECVMVFEDKIALGFENFTKSVDTSDSSDSIDPTSSEGETDPFRPTNFEDAKKLLSQKMAAQYLIFQNAKVNPDGSVPPRSKRVDLNKEATSAASSAKSTTIAAS